MRLYRETLCHVNWRDSSLSWGIIKSCFQRRVQCFVLTVSLALALERLCQATDGALRLKLPRLSTWWRHINCYPRGNETTLKSKFISKTLILRLWDSKSRLSFRVWVALPQSNLWSRDITSWLFNLVFSPALCITSVAVLSYTWRFRKYTFITNYM